MKKLLALLVLLLGVAVSSPAQVSFSKFKLVKNEPFGQFPGRKSLESKFKVTGDKEIKYVFVDWYMVNSVGDVVSGVTQGVVTEGAGGEDYIKPKTLQCTGPFSPGKSSSGYAPNVGYAHGKVFAFPWRLRIMYMGETDFDTIVITKENLSVYFPKLTWIPVNRYSPTL